MTISTRQQMITTSHGTLAVEESGQGGLPVLLIHGNSFCRGVFRNQMQGQIAKSHRFIAFDLPGHGKSSDATDPKRSYTRAGLADAAVELLDKLGVTEAIVFGWSLGGHIGIEMIPRFPGMRGLMISGAPPVRHNVFYGEFDSTKKILRYINAGHCPPILISAAGEAMSLKEGDLPVGLLPGTKYQELQVALPSGSSIVVFSDGVPDAVNLQGEEFGEERIINCCTSLPRGASAEAICMCLFSKVAEWASGVDQFDDTTCE
jgi:pimeloyl-ACP methyl ester carboxylesterase